MSDNELKKKSVSNDHFSINSEEAFDFHLRSAWLDVSRMYNEIALSRGISMSMAFILINISKKGSNPTKLGPRMGMQANSLSRTLKSLEDKGLITRKKEKGDKREVLIFLTEEGLKGRHIANSIIADFNEKLFERVPEKKRQIFQEVIGMIHDTIKDMRSEMGLPEEL